MAGLFGSAQTAQIATGVAKKTLVQIVAPANQRLLIWEIAVSFEGVSNTGTPILVEVAEQSDAGTMSVLTPSKRNTGQPETLQATAQHTATGQPTETDVIMSDEVHPQGGFLWQAPFNAPIIVSGGDRVGVAVTADASISAVARIMYEE